jgi:outer membrane protein assembly factor BamB
MVKKKLFLKWICFSVVLLLLIPSFSSSAFSAAEGSDVSSFDEISFWCYSGTDSFEKESMMRVMIQDHEVELNNAECKPLQNLDDPLSLSRIGSISGPMSSPWPMKCHDNRHTGLSPYSTVDNNGAELWNFRADGWIGGGPIIDDEGIIYFGDEHGYFYALNSDGSLKWESPNDLGDISGTPALGDDGTIYVGSWDQNLYALSSSNGSVIWTYDAGGTIVSSPAIGDDGTIYFGTLVGFDQGDIVAVNPDGTLKWKYETGYYITSDPAIGDDGTIYIGSGDNYLYALNSNGTLRWRFKTGHYIKGPPSIDEDGTIYVGSFDGYLYALFPDGGVKWQCKIGAGTETNPSIGPDGTIYVGGLRLYAVNPEDGTLKWSFDPGEDQIIAKSSPAVSAEGSIYFGTNIGETDGGDIVALNADGTVRWRHRIADEWVDSSPCIDENGVIYIGSSSAEPEEPYDFYGVLYAFGHGEEVNEPPNTPSIQGQTSGKPGETYTYTIQATDYDNDMISYFVDWDDDSDSGWQGPYSSGTSIELSHSWSEKDSYIIKAKAMDSEGSESTWATLQVSMPKNKDVFDSLLARFFQAYPWLFSLIENLL